MVERIQVEQCVVGEPAHRTTSSLGRSPGRSGAWKEVGAQAGRSPLLQVPGSVAGVLVLVASHGARQSRSLRSVACRPLKRPIIPEAATWARSSIALPASMVACAMLFVGGAGNPPR
jgi:hypothetical protein